MQSSGILQLRGGISRIPCSRDLKLNDDFFRCHTRKTCASLHCTDHPKQDEGTVRGFWISFAGGHPGTLAIRHVRVEECLCPCTELLVADYKRAKQALKEICDAGDDGSILVSGFALQKMGTIFQGSVLDVSCSVNLLLPKVLSLIHSHARSEGYRGLEAVE